MKKTLTIKSYQAADRWEKRRGEHDVADVNRRWNKRLALWVFYKRAWEEGHRSASRDKAKMRRMLRKAEWWGGACFCCYNKREKGHKKGCELARMLEEGK